MALDQMQYAYGVNATLASNAAADQTVIDAPGANKKLRLKYVHIGVTVAATGGGGAVSLEDGVNGTILFTIGGDTTGAHYASFETGGPLLSYNTLLNLTVNGAATTQASARATVVCTIE